MNIIGTLNEKSLHAALKDWYVRPGDQLEKSIDGFIIDVVRGNELIEIQTGSFASIKRKVQALVKNHPVRLVYPIAREKWIVRLAKTGAPTVAGRRRSPMRGTWEQVFEVLVSFPGLIADSNFSLEVLITLEEEIRCHNRKRGWRRGGWVTHERRLLGVIDRKVIHGPEDLLFFIPACLTQPWTTADLAAAIGQPRWLAQKMVYCLREAGVIKMVGKQGNAIIYAKKP